MNRAATLHAGEPAWDEFVSSHASATGYHRWAWRRVFEHAFGHATRYLSVIRDGVVVGILPLVLFDSRLFGRFGVSLPFVNYGGVVAAEDDVAEALLDGAIREARAARLQFLELRHTDARFAHLQSRRHKVAMTLRLQPTAEEQWAAVGKKVRNQVRKAEKSGLHVKVGRDELIGAFYSVFERNMRDLGTPVYARAFFETVLEAEGPRGHIVCVYLGDHPIAASLILGHGRSCEVPWASSIRDFNHLCGNMLLYWAMLRHAILGGYTVFDFGRSTRDGSTFTFKRQWRAEPTELVWEYWTGAGEGLPDFTPSSPRYRLATAAWQRLPLAIASRLGPRIVRNIP